MTGFLATRAGLPTPARPATEGRARIVNNAAEELALTCGSNMPEAMAMIEKNTRYSVTTGFDGKAELADIKHGKYWIFGTTKTRRGCAFWLHEIDLTKSQSVTLDQNNALMVQ